MAQMTLAEVETKINALLTNPQVDYKEGNITVSSGQKLTQLLEYRQHLIDNPTAEQELINFNMSLNEFGEELGQTVD